MGLLYRIKKHLPYKPAAFWDQRAAKLIEIYDHPEDWDRIGWMAAGAEEDVVPELLRAAGAQSVLVIGAGSGRQYGYLEGFEVTGVDISPRLVEECRQRYPHIQTDVADVTALDHPRVDAIISSGVLQHVTPDKIATTVEQLKRTASRLVVVREMTRLSPPSKYQFPHDYRELFAPDWRETRAVVTDDRPEVAVELVAFAPAT